jgi:Effector Associated Constant Component 1
VEIRISADGDGRVAYLESLSDWLRAESELRGRVALVNSVPQEGELGGVLDTLVVAAGSGGTLTVLASALKSWLSRPRGTDVHIVRLESDKAKVEIDAHRLDRDTAGWLIRKALGESVPENEQ